MSTDLTLPTASPSTTSPATTSPLTTAPSTSEAPRRTATAVEIWLLGMVAFGVAIVAVPWVRGDFFNWVATGDAAWPADAGSEARDYLRFSFCLLGALTAGLGTALWFIARNALRRGERWAWIAIVVSIAVWLVIDSVASVATGFPRNVVLNAALVAPALAILLAGRPRAPHTAA